jgi:hypothetical protein
MIPLLQEGALRMSSVSFFLRHVMQVAYTLVRLLVDVVRFLRCSLRSSAALAAENLFLRKQLALYQERHVTPRRASDATRLALVCLAR